MGQLHTKCTYVLAELAVQEKAKCTARWLVHGHLPSITRRGSGAPLAAYFRKGCPSQRHNGDVPQLAEHVRSRDSAVHPNTNRGMPTAESAKVVETRRHSTGWRAEEFFHPLEASIWAPSGPINLPLDASRCVSVFRGAWWMSEVMSAGFTAS